MKFFREVKSLPFKEFSVLVGSPYNRRIIRQNIVDGYIYIIKNVIPKMVVDSFIRRVTSTAAKEVSDSRLLEGVGNIMYKSRSAVERSDQYKANDISWYFFPWNDDETGAIQLFQKIYNHVIRLNGYFPEEVLACTPKSGMVQRFHLINYPLKSGEISMHVDPINLVDINSGVYCSEFGVDYDSGGFFVINENHEKVKLDSQIEKGDMVLFSPAIIHGVDPIDNSITSKMKNTSGRYFFNMSIIESHEMPDRKRTFGLSLETLGAQRK